MASPRSKTKKLNTSLTGEGSSSSPERVAEVREAMKTVKEISDLLNTGLDDETLRICVQLLEAGVNPEALANVVQELRREVAALREEEEAKR